MADAERRGFLGRLRERSRELRWAASGLAIGVGLAWLLDLTDQTAPVWTFVGVVAVALLTVATAESRHERQLDAESNRLRQQLDGEAARQMQQLEAASSQQTERLMHQRATAAREDIIAVAEEALQALREAEQQMVSLEASGAIAQMAAYGTAAATIGTRPLTDPKLRARFVECRSELKRLDARMSVRFRRDATQLRAFRAATKEFDRALGSANSIVNVLAEPRAGEPDIDQIASRREAFSQRVRGFEDAVTGHTDRAAA